MMGPQQVEQAALFYEFKLDLRRLTIELPLGEGQHL